MSAVADDSSVYVTNQSFEVGSGSLHKEVCVDEKWYDSRKANDVLTDEDITHPDSPQADVPSSGIALEEDCTASPCNDKSTDVYVAPFEEGVPPASANPYIGRDGTDLDVWRQENPVSNLLGSYQGVVVETAEDGTLTVGGGTEYQVSDYIINAFDVEVMHNTVQTRNNADAAEGTAQDIEGVSLSNNPLENSRIDDEDDEWGLTQNLSYGIGNNGSGYPSGGCYGASRKQSTDISKTQRAYANSYVREAHIKDTGQSNCLKDGQWVNPDKTTRTVQKGGLSCDLTGQDWGIAVDSGAVTGLNYPSCTPAVGKIHEGGDTTENLSWGTTGSTSIVLPDPEDSIFNLQTFCIGNQCQESTDNQAPNAGTNRTQYLNRDVGDLNGTITVQDSVQISSTEELCIGSGCPDFEGSANETELYGLQGQGSDGPMDGPIEVLGGSDEKRGLPIEGSACFGSDC